MLLVDALVEITQQACAGPFSVAVLGLEGEHILADKETAFLMFHEHLHFESVSNVADLKGFWLERFPMLLV